MKKTITFDNLMDDCVSYISMGGSNGIYVLALDGKSHRFKNTEEIVPFVENELGYKVEM